MKTSLLAIAGSLLSMGCYAEVSDATVLGLITVGKTTIQEFVSKVPKVCNVQKERDAENKYFYSIKSNCFNLLGDPEISMWTSENQRITNVRLSFNQGKEYKEYYDILVSKYGETSSYHYQMIEHSSWRYGDTEILLRKDVLSHFVIDYYFDGDSGKYDSKYRNQREHTKGLM